MTELIRDWIWLNVTYHPIPFNTIHVFPQWSSVPYKVDPIERGKIWVNRWRWCGCGNARNGGNESVGDNDWMGGRMGGLMSLLRHQQTWPLTNRYNSKNKVWREEGELIMSFYVMCLFIYFNLYIFIYLFMVILYIYLFIQWFVLFCYLLSDERKVMVLVSLSVCLSVFSSSHVFVFFNITFFFPLYFFRLH